VVSEAVISSSTPSSGLNELPLDIRPSLFAWATCQRVDRRRRFELRFV